jgi:predicted dehydrogenase
MSIPESPLNRRDFLALSAAGVGSGLALALPGGLRENDGGPSSWINLALIGFGKQGQLLLAAMRNIPGIHVQAVCDIWNYNRTHGMHSVRPFQQHIPNGYVDIDDMLATEKGLDAAIIATPDCWHADHTTKCLKAGLHVYCEKMMSNTIDGARAIVHAAETSGMLCQIGYQRRSNPRYRYTLEQLIQRHKICGQITAFNSQWNRSVVSSQDISFNPKLTINQEVLSRYGYRDMHQFMNWRHFRNLAGGPFCDLASHQLDVCAWFLGGVPKSLMASGGNDFFKDREVFDDMMAILEYETATGTVRAFSQVLGAAEGYGGYYERFMGTTATVNMSERAEWTRIVPGSYRFVTPPWEELERRGFLKRIVTAPELDRETGHAIVSYSSRPSFDYSLPGGLNKPVHQPHLENFFAAIRGEAKLNCDARTAFQSEAPIYYMNAAARNRQPIDFTPVQLTP